MSNTRFATSSERRFYTGVGSRETPPEIGEIMRNLAFDLAGSGLILRSGGAEGADAYFQEGATSYLKQLSGPMVNDKHIADVYIIEGGFNGLYDGDPFVIDTNRWHERNRQAELIASSIHPAWYRCGPKVKALHTRNVYQVLGPNLNRKSEFLVCWAEADSKGMIQGGTATAWNLANRLRIPCFNLYNHFDLLEIESRNFLGAV